jgi:hypothetical protein
MRDFLRLIEQSELHPELVDRCGHKAVRYVRQTSEEALILKFARLVSLNSTLLSLVEMGRVMEQGIIQRSIEETNEDIYFIGLNLTEEEKSEKYEGMISEFWKEDYEDPNDPVGTRIGRAYSRRGIRSHINRALGQEDPSTADAVSRSVYEMYSGFLHGAAPQILEIYNYEDRRFETDGISGTNRHIDYVFDAQNSIYRSLLSMGVIGKAFGSESLFDLAIEERDRFERATGSDQIFKKSKG